MLHRSIVAFQIDSRDELFLDIIVCVSISSQTLDESRAARTVTADHAGQLPLKDPAGLEHEGAQSCRVRVVHCRVHKVEAAFRLSVVRHGCEFFAQSSTV